MLNDPFAAQPAEKSPASATRCQPSVFAPMLTRHGDTCCVDHLGFDTARPQPPRQPEAISASLEGHDDPADRATGLGRLVAPAMQQPKQRRLRHRQLFQRLAVDAGNDPGDQPLDWLISITAINVLSWPRAASDLLRSFDCGMGHSVGCHSDDGALSSPLAP